MAYHFGITGVDQVRTVNTEDGPIERVKRFFLVGCQDNIGHRWVRSDFIDPSEGEAQAHLDAIRGSTPETDPDLWEATDPVYGSEAWDSEAEYELACFEADCFNEPRPIWR